MFNRMAEVGNLIIYWLMQMTAYFIWPPTSPPLISTPPLPPLRVKVPFNLDNNITHTQLSPQFMAWKNRDFCPLSGLLFIIIIFQEKRLIYSFYRNILSLS